MAEGTHHWTAVAALRVLLKCSAASRAQASVLRRRRRRRGRGHDKGALAASGKTMARARPWSGGVREDDGVGRLPRSGAHTVKQGHWRGGRRGHDGNGCLLAWRNRAAHATVRKSTKHFARALILYIVMHHHCQF
jgi:hypothetical protein